MANIGTTRWASSARTAVSTWPRPTRAGCSTGPPGARRYGSMTPPARPRPILRIAGGSARQIGAAGLPYPFPSLFISPVPPYRGRTPVAYAKIITTTAPVYRHPYDALAGLPPLRRFETGYDYVSLLGQVQVDGHNFY